LKRQTPKANQIKVLNYNMTMDVCTVGLGCDKFLFQKDNSPMFVAIVRKKILDTVRCCVTECQTMKTSFSQ